MIYLTAFQRFVKLSTRSKMKDYVEQVRSEMKRLRFNPHRTARFLSTVIPVSFREIERWIGKEYRPHRVFRPHLRRGVRELKRIPTPRRTPLENFRDEYRTISSLLSVEEKTDLLKLRSLDFEQRIAEQIGRASCRERV